MSRKLLFLIAPVLASLSLLVGPALAPARAAAPTKPVVAQAVSTQPLTCIINMPLLGKSLCLQLS